jgi:hypothetical protein
LERVAFSRVDSKEAFAVAEDILLDVEMFLKIGQGKTYWARQEFEGRIRLSADRERDGGYDENSRPKPEGRKDIRWRIRGASALVQRKD